MGSCSNTGETSEWQDILMELRNVLTSKMAELYEGLCNMWLVKLVVSAHTSIPATGRMMQVNCCKLEAILGCIVSSRLPLPPSETLVQNKAQVAL